MPATTLSALLLAAAAMPAAERAALDRQVAALDRQVAAIYRPYSIEAAADPAWDRPIFSRDVAALVARWKQVMPEGELDGLNDGDWLCLCQDWNPKKFRVVTRSRQHLGQGAAEVRLRIDLGIGQTRDIRLVFRQEAGSWRIDEFFASDFPHGIKQALRETIAADERLPK